MGNDETNWKGRLVLSRLGGKENVKGWAKPKWKLVGWDEDRGIGSGMEWRRLGKIKGRKRNGGLSKEDVSAHAQG
jgi:hypothetical protein